MKRTKFDLSPVEPAHPMQVKLQEDLFYIYTHIRTNFQTEIDRTFDSVARQIGFVVTTTIEVTLKIDKGGTVAGGIIIDGMQYKNTLLEKALDVPFSKIVKKPFPKEITPGEYKIYLFWFEALKLKLRTDWMEPAHAGRLTQNDRIRYNELAPPREKIPVKPEVLEPVHWFNPSISISDNELILVSVIDEVYPELRLVDKISTVRESRRGLVPSEVMEPVHFRRPEQSSEFSRVRDLLNELDSILKQLGY